MMQIKLVCSRTKRPPVTTSARRHRGPEFVIASHPICSRQLLPCAFTTALRTNTTLKEWEKQNLISAMEEDRVDVAACNKWPASYYV
ncbi:hypothetical protein EVAR_7147_1 [Eumeta japonica]|uniref:Uncharacterized protein n=1 Tax=Eumeta variegata TaxID=151549 RepID=A0A4C1U7P3_EUMVA|nr:hypothetical protein EVAR_7147_1 [Eumeta japonica]